MEQSSLKRVQSTTLRSRDLPPRRWASSYVSYYKEQQHRERDSRRKCTPLLNEKRNEKRRKKFFGSCLNVIAGPSYIFPSEPARHHPRAIATSRRAFYFSDRISSIPSRSTGYIFTWSLNRFLLCNKRNCLLFCFTFFGI